MAREQGQLRVCKSAIEVKLERVLAALKKQDVETLAEYLIVRDIKEYLMIREYRERKLRRAQAKTAAALAADTSNTTPATSK